MTMEPPGQRWPWRGPKPFQPAAGRDFGSVEDVEAQTHILLRAPKEGHSINTLSIASGFPAIHQPRDAVKTAKKNCVQLDFAPKAMERLNALTAKTEAASYAEVVKNALRLYEALIEKTESGKQFLVKDEAGTVAPSRLFL
jgi:hypothetical protein